MTTKQRWCNLDDRVASRTVLERAAWNLTPRNSRSRVAGQRGIRFDPPAYAQQLKQLSIAALRRYITSRCKLTPPKGRYTDTVPLGRR